MKPLDEANLSVIKTGEGTNRVMITVRFEGSFVAALSFSVQKGRDGVEKKGFWVQFIPRPGLSKTQVVLIKQFLDDETLQYLAMTFGDQ